MAQVFASMHPLVLNKITQLRTTTTPPAEFRRLVRSLSMLLAYEATADLPTRTLTVMTPLAETTGHALADSIAIVPILRAGLGMADGVLDLIPEAQVWHVGLRRDERTLLPQEYLNKIPRTIQEVLVIVVDPMLATGGSAVHACELLKNAGIKRLKYIALIAAPEGLRLMSEKMPDVPVYVGVVDERLNSVGFIHPGLGDAGDRQFGTFQL